MERQKVVKICGDILAKWFIFRTKTKNFGTYAMGYLRYKNYYYKWGVEGNYKTELRPIFVKLDDFILNLKLFYYQVYNYACDREAYRLLHALKETDFGKKKTERRVYVNPPTPKVVLEHPELVDPTGDDINPLPDDLFWSKDKKEKE